MKIKSLILATLLSTMSLSAFAEMINMNKADAATFQHYLKGVGQKKADNIIKYRVEHKSFKTIEEIMEVKGIGEGIFKKIKEDLSLTSGKVTAPEKKAASKKDKPDSVALSSKAKTAKKVTDKKLDKTSNKADTSKEKKS